MICFFDNGPPAVAGVCANAMPVQATIAKAKVKGFIGVFKKGLCVDPYVLSDRESITLKAGALAELRNSLPIL